MEAHEVTLRSEGVELAGTLLTPEQPRGVVLLVSGSGPLDRDTNHRRARLRVMGLLADALADAGWASLRYDKRGVGASGGDYWTAGLHDNISDAAAAARRARELVAAPCVVVGHSEGAVIALALASDASLVDGAVLLSGMAGTGEQTLRWQAQALESEVPWLARAVLRVLRTSVVQQQDKQLAKLAASTRDTYRAGLLAKVNARWFREFLAFDAGAALEAAQAPLLAVTGSKDVQVDPGDLEVMAARAGAPIETVLVPDVDHILRHQPGTSSPRRYPRQARAPLDPRVVQTVTEWLARLPETAG